MAEFTGERVIPGQVETDLMNEHLARYAFSSRLARGKRVLDAGCGAGYGSAELAKSAVWVTGVDVSAEAVAYARENYRLPNLTFERASCAALPHPNASFDLVVAFEVIEHLEDWRTFLMEVRRVLSPTGQFIVSTPNKLYYGESRAESGPNPFHVHEFEYNEFRGELGAVFPNISMFLENHVEGMVFRPAGEVETADVRVDGGEVSPAEAHFFIAVCAHRPQTGNPAFVYVPKTGNVLRERERHIDLLRNELRTKDEWLEKAKGELAALNEDHRKLLGLFREQQAELERRNEWALKLNQELEESGRQIRDLQQELEREQAQARAVVEAYEGKVAELERENREKTEWALETEKRLGAELEAKSQELVRSVDLLHEAEKTVDERTAWALSMQSELDALRAQIDLVTGSRWVKLGRRLGLGPVLPVR